MGDVFIVLRSDIFSLPIKKMLLLNSLTIVLKALASKTLNLFRNPF